jgi:citrate lyase subunit beta / citryl-CoA lyase
VLARRSSLSVPASSEKMVTKAPGLGADELVLDLEDSVAPAAKADARDALAAFLARRPETPAMAVRVNALGSRWFRDDVMVLVERAGTAIDSLVLPKVERAADLEAVDALLDDLGERAAAIRTQALIETAAGLLRAGEIADSSERLDALILGYADLAASLGRRADPGPEGWLHAQETVLVAARAAGVQAIDGPYLAIRDADGLRQRVAHVRALGFDGKWAVHPEQLGVISEAFTPRLEEFTRACAIVAAFEGAESPGALELDGEMIDEASRKLAAQVVARGRAAGLSIRAREAAG